MAVTAAKPPSRPVARKAPKPAAKPAAKPTSKPAARPTSKPSAVGKPGATKPAGTAKPTNPVDRTSVSREAREADTGRTREFQNLLDGMEFDPADDIVKHKVADGENLTGIVKGRLADSGLEATPQAINGGIEGIRQANDLADVNKIKAGQELTLPRDLAEGPVFKGIADLMENPGDGALRDKVGRGLGRLFQENSPTTDKKATSDQMVTNEMGARFHDHMIKTGRNVAIEDAQSVTDKDGFTNFQFSAIGENSRLGIGGGIGENGYIRQKLEVE